MRKHLASIAALAAALAFSSPATPQEETPESTETYSVFLGQIVPVGFNFCPRGMTPANGGQLEVSRHTALFSLYGFTYGGDGLNYFGLPDMRGRMPLHHGEIANGHIAYPFGAATGAPRVTLAESNLILHTHPFVASSASPNARLVTQASLANFSAGSRYAASGSELNTPMNIDMVQSSGDGAPIDIRHPYLALNYCVVLVGEYPARP